jgi:long-chain acyl-CoA synthetase
MREAHEPTLIAPITSGGLVEPVIENARDFPNTVVLIKRHGSTWLDVTAAAFLAEVQAVAKGLIAKGIEPGQRVGLMSRTRYEWTLADYAIWYAGAVTVPIYETSSAEQVQWILSDSDAVALFNESPLHGELLAEIRDSLPDVRQSWTFDEGAIRDLMAAGRAVTDEVLERRRQTVTPDSMATIIYTSGTTGRPKGCVLTHSNFMFECDNIVAALPELFLVGESSTLLFLPLAHVFGRAIQIGCVRARTKLAFAPDVSNLLADLNTFKPTFVLSVPRVFEKVFNGASQKAQAEGKGAIFERAARVAQAYSQAQSSGGPSLILKLQHAVFDRLVYGKLRAAMGGNVAWAVSGGAPLGERLGHFFRGVGITILEGYGLTETSAASNLNRPSNIRVGTVGRPIPGSTIRIADDGEVLIKGAFVFTKYWKNEAGTREAIDSDGWFHSGDIGVLDDAGFLSITGRKKEIIVTAGGKNVAPAALEDRLRANWLVSQCIVVGDNQPFIGCLITLDPESLPAWLAQHGRDADTSLVDLSQDSELIADIQLAVDDANRSVSHAEAIKKFAILPVDWTEENGLLTPSLKLKRAEVLKQFNTAVDDLYS